MRRSVRLRPWQRRALVRLNNHAHPDFLTVATPGAGKTTFALTALRARLIEHPRAKIVIVAPTAHLKTQWVEAAAAFDLHLDDAWQATRGTLPADVHGIVTTYQQVTASTDELRSLARGALIVLDEIHHAGDERSWGLAVLSAFAEAQWRLSLSGTPFRSDTRAIPFVRYDHDEAIPDFEYGYGDALREGRVVRPVEFPRLNGEMEWVGSDGSMQRASFDEHLDASRTAQRLRTALSLDGEWLPTVLKAADVRLQQVRSTIPDAGGLVIANDQEHARGIADILRNRFGSHAVVATSDDPEASARIARFRGGRDPWIVAVRMVSEGVDIPRLRVGVFATSTTTELFFRQAVGRLVRWSAGEADQQAYLFIPDDARLRKLAYAITEQRRHSLRRRETTSDETAFDEPNQAARPEEQMSLFATLSAVPVGDLHRTEVQFPQAFGHDEATPRDDLDWDLPPLPGGPHLAEAASSPHHPPQPQESPAKRRKTLRARNAARVSELVRHANLSHAKVNAELNRLAGISGITQATEEQLIRRLEVADRWLRS